MNSVFHPRSILFFVNPRSGGRSKKAIVDCIREGCANKIRFRIVTLTKQINITDELDAFKPEMAVAVGGDGTINAVGSQLVGTDTILGIIPCGSSNALARNLYLPHDPVDALHLLFSTHVKEIDTLLIDGRNCFHICDVGFNARVVERSHKRRIRGWLNYGISVLEEIFDMHFFRYGVSTPKIKLQAKAFSIAITNTKAYGNSAAINPLGKVNDGFFEICIIKPFPKRSLPSMFLRLFRRNIHKSHYCMFIRTNEAVIANMDNEAVHIDGDPVHLGSEFSVGILPRSLKVAVPKGIN
jgi:diacylglycerol kinase family enzyme